MVTDDPADPNDQFSPRAVLPGEEILHRWLSPGGRGLLTNFRCLLLGHPHPLHRSIRWTINLEGITSLSVEVARGFALLGEPTHAALGGGEASSMGISTDHAVEVDGVPVYLGNPTTCADIQQWIDDARTARCLALFGRLLPFGPREAPTSEPAVPPPVPSLDTGTPGASGPGSEIILFLSGVPYTDAGPSRIAGHAWGAGPLVGLAATVPGGHEPADFRPGQMYGWQAELGRLVLDIALHVGVSVRVVDVDRPGPDLVLVQRYVGPAEELPILVGPRGRRIAGDDSFVPKGIEQFLRAE